MRWTRAPVVRRTDDETTHDRAQRRLSIDKSVSQTTATAGDQFNWILDITNHGPDLATNLVVSDTVPAAFEVIGTFPRAGLSCTNTGNSVQCTAASLANGATRPRRGAGSGARFGSARRRHQHGDSRDRLERSDTATTATRRRSRSPRPGSQAPFRRRRLASGTSSSGVTLPRTGNGSLSAVVGSTLFVGGIFSLVIARRRRVATA